jgi:uncharacterized membrane protein
MLRMTDNKELQTRRPAGVRRLRAFRTDQRGIISVMAALSLFLIIAVAAVVIDAGALLLARRSLQSTTDAAALSAAQHLPGGTASAVSDVLTANGYDADSLDLIETGAYTASPTTTVSNRFVPVDAADPSVNAVRVTTKATVATYFTGVLGLSNINTVHATATATQTPSVTFEAGTRLASLDNGLANQLLGGLLGGSLSLSLVDYQALADTKISALSFLDALASEINLSSGSTYGDLLASNVTVGQILNAGITVLQATGEASGSVSGSISALQQLTNQASTGTSINLGNLISASSIANRNIGTIASSSDGGGELNLYGIVAGTARTAGAGQIVNLDTGVTIPVVGSSVKVKLVVGQAKQIATGPVGTSIDTAQVRLAIDLQLANVSLAVPTLGTLVATGIDLPIYVEGASGKATVAAIPCQTDGTMVTLSGQTGAVTLHYGTVTNGGLADLSSSPTVTNATIATVKLVNTSVAQISASGATTVAGGGPTDMDFTQQNIDDHDIKSMGGDDHVFNDNGTGALHTSIALLPGVNLGLLQSLLNASLTPILNSVTSQLDSALVQLDAPIGNLLTTLGLQLGVLDTDVVKAQCGVPVLVN